MSLPLRHDLVRVRQVTPRVLHLRRVGVADLVVGAPVVGALDHDDVGARAAQLDGVALARQLPPHHRHGDGSSTEGCGGRRYRILNVSSSLLCFFHKHVFPYKGIREQTGRPAIKRSDTETYEKRLSTPVENEWAQDARCSGVGGEAIPRETLARPGVMEGESEGSTRIKHEETDNVCA